MLQRTPPLYAYRLAQRYHQDYWVKAVQDNFMPGATMKLALAQPGVADRKTFGLSSRTACSAAICVADPPRQS